MFHQLIANVLPHLPQSFVWKFSKEYVAGQNVEEAISNAKVLNEQSIETTIDVLGEFITSLDQAEANKKEYLELIDKTHGAELKTSYSIKPTFFGLLLDKEVCKGHIREVLAKAASYGRFVRIDMEDSPCTDMEIAIFRELKQEFPDNVGLVIQAYLKRTYSDIESLADLNTPESPVNLRLCKGIYVEPAEIAYKDHDEINKNYLQDLELMLQLKMFPAIATHDSELVEGSYKLLEKYGVGKDQYEFQMLYGVTPALRQSVIDKGHAMRVYLPFGADWFGYCTRRLKENPRMVSMAVKALFNKG
ncbi:MAG: proline dehydrogenase [Desulfobacterales bacterium]|nr:MAG: proline dehydrogenase [Desulfobacterales bacterium]